MLVISNLLLDFEELVSLLGDRLDAAGADTRDRDEELLDAFLLAAGATQVVEDHLHRDVILLAKISARLESNGSHLAASVTAALLSAGIALRSLAPRERSAMRCARLLSAVVSRLADAVAGVAPPPGSTDRDLARSVIAQPVNETLRRSVVRLPNCFRSFDQHPDDCRRLVEGYAERDLDRRRPVLVVGLRTSGSYLAPLTASFLQALGFSSTGTATFRPGQPLSGQERRRLRTHAKANGVFLLVDDAPRTGGQLRQAADQLAEIGVPSDAVTLLLPTLAPELPEPLHHLDIVRLPWGEWAVHRRLTSDAVGQTLAALRGRPVTDVERTELYSDVASRKRRHTAAVFRAHVAGSGEEQVFVRGVGLGYLGRQSLAVATALPDFLPRVYGLHEGLLYREWIPEDRRLSAADADLDPGVAHEIARYAAARSRALPAGEDVTIRLVDRDAVWELVAAMLGRGFGRLRLALRPLLRAVARDLLHVSRPTIPDGGMRLGNWFTGEAGQLRKVAFEEHGFPASGDTPYTFDPLFDVAGVVVDGPATANGLLDAVRSEYEAETGEPVAAARWLLYRILQLELGTSHSEHGVEHALALERELARAHRLFVAGLFMADLEPPTTGSLCAIDIDGVLETRWLNYPALGPAGALALRALTCHGFRPVLVSGRSADDVVERCVDYRLAAGIAEYGAALWLAGSGTARPLLPERDRSDVERLRGALVATPAVVVDPAYRHGVRAYRADGSGGLAPATAASALVHSGCASRLRAIPGEMQTDFSSTAIDKGTALGVLAEELGATVELAVGDSVSDLPMLALARHGFAPSNAAAAVRAARFVRVIRQPYQSGLLAATEVFLGHRPGCCPICRPPALPHDARVLLTVLAAHDAERRGKLAHAFSLARLVVTEKVS